MRRAAAELDAVPGGRRAANAWFRFPRLRAAGRRLSGQRVRGVRARGTLRLPRRSRVLHLALLATLLCVQSASADDTASAEERAVQRIGLFEAYHWPIKRIVRHWMRHGSDTTDFRGLTVKDDLTGFVLPRGTEERMAALLRKAKQEFAARDWPASISTSDQAIDELQSLVFRLNAVQDYWDHVRQHTATESLWRQARAAHGLSDSGVADRHELISRIEEQVRSQDFIGAARDEIPAVRRLLMETVDSGRAAAGIDVLTHDPFRVVRQRRCQGVGTSVRHGAAPSEPARLRTSASVAPIRFRPQAGKTFGILRPAFVRVHLQADACPQWAEVAKSSGDAGIDAAAQRYALEGARYYPARQDGKPIAGTVEIVVDFSDVTIDVLREPW